MIKKDTIADILSYRLNIQKIDQQIIKLIKKRINYSKKLYLIKKKYNLNIRDKKIEKKVKENIVNSIKKNKLPQSLAKELSTLLIKYSLKVQKISL